MADDILWVLQDDQPDATETVEDWLCEHHAPPLSPVELQDDILEVNVLAEPATSSLQAPAAPAELACFGIRFTTREIKYLMQNEIALYCALKSVFLDVRETEWILHQARRGIKTLTRAVIADHDVYLLGETPIATRGYAGAKVYYACTQLGRVLVAKVYSGDDLLVRRAFDREVNANSVVEEGNHLVKFITIFIARNSMGHVSHAIILMPFFPCSVADLLAAQSPLRFSTIAFVVRDCVTALRHLHTKGFCFGDLKPSNIMLQDGAATLVDFGAAVRLGTQLVEFTPTYCMDAVVQGFATEDLDWVCLGTTLAHLAGFDLQQLTSRQVLADAVASSTGDTTPILRALIARLLLDPLSSIDADLLALAAEASEEH